MKKYENPEITITMFDSESVLCDSITAVETAKNALGEGVTATAETTLDQFTLTF